MQKTEIIQEYEIHEYSLLSVYFKKILYCLKGLFLKGPIQLSVDVEKAMYILT